MQKHLSKNLSLLVLVIATLAALSHILLNLKKETTAQADKTISKKADNSELRPHGLIREALMPKQSDLEFCYEIYLKTKPEVSEGSVTIRWLIEADGTVLSTDMARSEINDEFLTSCILEKLRGLSFSPPPERRQTMLTYKLHFRRKTQAALNFSE